MAIVSDLDESEADREFRLLHHVCSTCGQLYFWCHHHAPHSEVPTEQARIALARTLIAHEFDPKSTVFDNSEIQRAKIRRVFG